MPELLGETHGNLRTHWRLPGRGGLATKGREEEDTNLPGLGWGKKAASNADHIPPNCTGMRNPWHPLSVLGSLLHNRDTTINDYLSLLLVLTAIVHYT